MRSSIPKLAILLLALLAPGRVFAAAPTDRTPVRIEVPSASNLQFLTLWVAVGAGYFQEQGLEPKIIVASAPRLTGQLLLNGSADVVLLPPPMFLGMMAEDKPIRLFASLLANEPINLVVAKNVAVARKISTAGSLRARLRALKGLKVGLAGEVTPRLRALFASVGMDADKDIQRVVVAGPDQVQALAKGEVDVLFAHTPYLETVLVTQQAVLIADTSGGEVSALSGGQVHALATTSNLARTKPQLIQAVAKAIERAILLLHSDPKASVDALVAYGAAGADRRMLEAIVAIYGPAVPRTPKVSLEGIRRDAVLYPAHPRAPDFAKTKAADFVAAEFAAKAIGTGQ